MCIDLLEQNKGALQIILYLSKHEKASLFKLVSETKISRQRCHSTIRKLTELGILYAYRERGWPTKVFYKLSHRGSKIAKHLHKIETMLEDTIDGCKKQLLKFGQEYKLGTDHEKKRVQILQKLVHECFRCGEWDEAITYGKELVTCSKRTHDDKELVEALINIGRIHEIRHEFDEAFKCFRKGFKIALKVKKYEDMASNSYNIGAIFEAKGNYTKALAYYEQCEEYAEKCGSEVNKARAYLGRGRIFALKGLYGDSIRIFEDAVVIFERFECKEELPKTYTCLGASEFYVNVNKAIMWHEKCIEISERIGDIRMLGYGLSNAAGYYIEKGEYRKAEGYLDRALPIFRKLDEKYMVASIQLHYARLFRSKRLWKGALEYLDRALDTAKIIKARSKIADVHFEKGLIYKCRGKETESKNNFNKALSLSRRLGDIGMVKEVEKELNELILLFIFI